MTQSPDEPTIARGAAGPGGVLGLALITVVTAVVMAAGSSMSAAAPTQSDGAQVYQQTCAACHQAGGVGVPGSFPPLAGNPNAADAAYVEQVIVEGVSGPIEVLGEAYDGMMTAVDLSDGDRAAVVEYVVGLATAAPGASSSTEDSAAAVEPIVGDAARGRALFTGSTGFELGGAACSSCHEAGDVGHWGGGSLGPDLDSTFTDFGGETGLATWLANPPSETMQPIFADEPLTEAEIADVVAFLETAPDRERPRTYGDGLLIGGLIGLGLLLAGMAFAHRTMSPGYAQRLRDGR